MAEGTSVFQFLFLNFRHQFCVKYAKLASGIVIAEAKAGTPQSLVVAERSGATSRPNYKSVKLKF